MNWPRKRRQVRRTSGLISSSRTHGERASATNEDYTRSGYDRGHMAPAGDMKWSAKAMRESFYLSNICPQKPGLNRGIWKDLEEQARLWAKENGSLLIVTGPVITDDLKRLGKNRVGIPKTFYKVICTITNGKPEGVVFCLIIKTMERLRWNRWWSLSIALRRLPELIFSLLCLIR
mgnify:FL=1